MAAPFRTTAPTRGGQGVSFSDEYSDKYRHRGPDGFYYESHMDADAVARDWQVGRYDPRNRQSSSMPGGGCLGGIIAAMLLIMLVGAALGFDTFGTDDGPDFTWTGTLACQEGDVGVALELDLDKTADESVADVDGSIEYFDGSPDAEDPESLGSSDLTGRASGGEVALFAQPDPGATPDAEPYEVRSIRASLDLFAPDTISGEVDAAGCTTLEASTAS